MSIKTVAIVTPQGSETIESVNFVQLPSITGEIGILPSHSPEIITLIPGKLTLELSNNQSDSYFIPGGMAVITLDTVKIMTDYSESVNKIDAERAIQAQKRAIKRLTKTNGTINKLRAKNAKDRAEARLNLASDAHSSG